MKWAAAGIAALIAGCGGGAADPDATVIDAGPDAEPDASVTPVCLEPPASANAVPCRECLVNPALPRSGSLCTETVCTVDPSCCSVGWTERCTELTDAVCAGQGCVNAISLGGDTAISYARYDGVSSFAGAVWSSPTDYLMPSLAWADYDADGDSDLAVVGTCYARVLRNDGWGGAELDLVEVFEHEPLADCHLGNPNPAFWGRRVRWADLDQDGDLDLAFGGDEGAFWVRFSAGAFNRAGDIVPASAGQLSDLALVDVDGVGGLDAIVTFADAPARLYRNVGGTWGQDAGWQGGLTSALTVELCDLVGDAIPEVILTGYAGNIGYALSGGGVGASLYPLGFPVPTAVDVACGDLDGDGKEEAAFLFGEGAVHIVDGEDGWVWDSDVDATPGFSEISFGVDVGDLDNDGDRDLVVSTGGVADNPFYVLWNIGIGGVVDFTPAAIVDLAPGLGTARAEMTWLAPPP